MPMCRYGHQASTTSIPMDLDIPQTLEQWNTSGGEYLPGHLGFEFLRVEPSEVVAQITVEKTHQAWNGFLHAGTVVALADTCCGYGTVRSLPEGADGFTTMELKSNFLSTVRAGVITCTATPLHQGRTTQVWDATVSAAETGKALAHFRCTQMILWPR